MSLTMKTSLIVTPAETLLPRRRRALLIDDEEDIREIGTMSLECGSGFEVLTASDGSSGTAIARDAQPDVILLDVMMPGDDGLTTFARLQSDASTRAIPVIFLTANDSPQEREQIARLAPLGLIAKPFDPMTLSAEVLAMLGE
jgi:CheY-like chemotaxis protein